VRAALLVGSGAIVVDDVAEPSPGPDDVLVRVGGVGLCGSDMSVFRGHWTVPSMPWILGHEAFGRVEAVGERVPTTRLGQLVVIEPNIPCLSCHMCRAGRTSSCTQRGSLGMNRPGALAEKVVVPSPFAWPADGLQAQDLVCVEPLSVVESALRRLTGRLPATALVVGAGSQGLLMCLTLLRHGVEVYATDPNPDRVALASAIGGRFASARDVEPHFALVVDTAGTPASMETALSRLENLGTLLVVGIDNRPFEISAAVLVRRQLTLRGSLTYDHPEDFRHAVELVQAGAVSPGRIVTDEYPLADVQRAFESSGHAPGKTWIRLDPA
jgi:2-desacetyl-2-hydroxyethyl bacteriochlorophyllide A dehydrogenase